MSAQAIVAAVGAQLATAPGATIIVAPIHRDVAVVSAIRADAVVVSAVVTQHRRRPERFRWVALSEPGVFDSGQGTSSEVENDLVEVGTYLLRTDE